MVFYGMIRINESNDDFASVLVFLAQKCELIKISIVLFSVDDVVWLYNGDLTFSNFSHKINSTDSEIHVFNKFMYSKGRNTTRKSIGRNVCITVVWLLQTFISSWSTSRDAGKAIVVLSALVVKATCKLSR